MRITQRTGIEGVAVEYILKFDNNEAINYCEYPMNQITLRLYTRPLKKGNTLYYEAGVGYTKDTFAVNLSADPCPKKIRIGIDERYVFNEDYIRLLICSLLKEQDFTSGKINLEDGIYTIGRTEKKEKAKAGNYVGTGYVIKKDGEIQFQKRF